MPPAPYSCRFMLPRIISEYMGPNRPNECGRMCTWQLNHLSQCDRVWGFSSCPGSLHWVLWQAVWWTFALAAQQNSKIDAFQPWIVVNMHQYDPTWTQLCCDELHPTEALLVVHTYLSAGETHKGHGNFHARLHTHNVKQHTEPLFVDKVPLQSPMAVHNLADLFRWAHMPPCMWSKTCLDI